MRKGTCREAGNTAMSDSVQTSAQTSSVIDCASRVWLNGAQMGRCDTSVHSTGLTALESESIYIIREAFSIFDKLGMLWSMGKDSTVLLWLARKAFFGHVPFPLIHIDTTYKIPSMIEYRDRMVRELNVELVIGRNEEVLASGLTFPNGGATRIECCSTLKTDALQAIVERERYSGLLVGVRRDEEPTRAKERYFSQRGNNMEWDVLHQPPEFWNQFRTDCAQGTHVRIHPLLHWTELDVWEYIEREEIPVIPLYFDDGNGYRYRSLGCAPCTRPIASNARTVSDIVSELRSTRIAERSGRGQDQESEDAFERLRRDGYM
jgi:sulfate adenylyltransferase subunit 2